MTPVAVLFLVIAIVVVWGGLVASILYLRAHPTDDTDDDVGVLGQAGGGGHRAERPGHPDGVIQ